MLKQSQTISFELAAELKDKFIKNLPEKPQTISFELAKKIDHQFKKLKDSYFYWYKDNTIDPKTNPTTFHSAILDIGVADEIYPAYQLHEILEMLPIYIFEENHDNYAFDFNRGIRLGTTARPRANIYLFSYKDIKTFEDENPAEAAGNLLLWCIENGYINV